MNDPQASDQRIAFVEVDIVRLLDDAYPGFVEARLVDAAGREWLFHDKLPIFTPAEIDAKGRLPRLGMVACRICQLRSRSDGRETAVIDVELPDHVEATTGETCFEVFFDRVTIAVDPG